jgi:hypothetical protein
MTLRSGATILGVVNRTDGYQLITSTHSFTVVNSEGQKSLMADEILYAI